MRAKLWTMLLATFTMTVPALALACPGGFGPDKQRPEPTSSPPAAVGPVELVSAATLADADLTVVNRWRDPDARRWVISSPAATCDQLDRTAVTATLGTNDWSCDPTWKASRTTLVLPRQLVEGNADWFRNGASPASMLPADVAVELVVYDIASESLLTVSYPSPDALPTTYDGMLADFHTSVLPSSLREHAWGNAPDVLHWVTDAILQLRDLEPREAVILMTPTDAGPVGIARVEHALEVLPPHAQYTVVSTSNDGELTRIPALETITNAGFATSATHVNDVRQLIDHRLVLTSDAPRAAAEARPSCKRGTQQSSVQQRRATARVWFVVALVLWYVIGLKVALFLMIRNRARKDQE